MKDHHRVTTNAHKDRRRRDSFAESSYRTGIIHGRFADRECVPPRFMRILPPLEWHGAGGSGRPAPVQKHRGEPRDAAGGWHTTKVFYPGDSQHNTKWIPGKAPARGYSQACCAAISISFYFWHKRPRWRTHSSPSWLPPAAPAEENHPTSGSRLQSVRASTTRRLRAGCRRRRVVG